MRSIQPQINADDTQTSRRQWFVERRMLINIVVIALGAAVGANLRYGVSLWAAAHLGATFPYGTLLINVAGSFVIGLVMAVSTQFRPMSEPLRLLVVTGLLGGFTTFSSLSYEAYSLLAQGN